MSFCTNKASKVSTFAREEVEIEIADKLLGDCVMHLPHLHVGMPDGSRTRVLRLLDLCEDEREDGLVCFEEPCLDL